MVIYYVLNILFQLNFDIFLGPFFFFCLFFLQKDLISFICFFPEFFLAFLIIVICHFIYLKIYEKYFLFALKIIYVIWLFYEKLKITRDVMQKHILYLIFFIIIFFIGSFFIRIFSVRIIMSLVMYSVIFFSLTT